MCKLVLIRHGQSVWNKENLFTGWTDISLSQQGIAEAKRAGQLLKKYNFKFDLAYTSVLKRAIDTLDLALQGMDHHKIEIIKDWRLNERHYGALQGLNKKETAEKYGDEQVHIWRRSFDTKPPQLDADDERYPGKDPLYKGLNSNELPQGESLKDTIDRFMPLWHDEIEPQIRKGKRIIISAHGNTLRALVKQLEHMSDEDIPALEIPTGVPLVYNLDDNINVIDKKYLEG